MKTTPLYQAHLRHGGRMVAFAGYALPLQYTSIVEEHLAVRRKAGLFDVSHMGEFLIRGEEALPFLQWATVNDVGKLKVGRAQYSMLPSEKGGVVDDIYLYRLGEAVYLMVVNAANIAKDLDHLKALTRGFRVEVEDVSEATALLALQGPEAAAILQSLTGADLSARRKNDVFEAQVAGRPARLARTGYTGEDGFELFLAPEDAEAVFEALLAAGARPCGLGARDTLRLEAGFPLYGHELTEATNPLCTPWAWVVKREKDFLGKEAMLASPWPGKACGPGPGDGDSPGRLRRPFRKGPRGPGDQRGLLPAFGEGDRPGLRGKGGRGPLLCGGQGAGRPRLH
jgi:aminomethyltransferase